MLRDFLRRWHWKQPEKRISLNVVNAIELRKDSTYILLADNHAVTRADMYDLMTSIRKQGIQNVVGFMLGGSPEDSIQIIEDTKPKGKKSYATSQARH